MPRGISFRAGTLGGEWASLPSARGRGCVLEDCSIRRPAVSRSPLNRALESRGFPQPRPLPAALEQSGCCVHIPALGVANADNHLALELLRDIRQAGGSLRSHRSKRHLQIWGDKLIASKTFTAIVARLLTLFGLTLVDSWVNVYRNGGESKAFHHDNYQDRRPNPTVTIGLSLGSARDLAFEDRKTGERFRVRQSNGDVFAFDSTFNKQFSHGIPEASGDEETGLRLSVILWAVEGQGLAVPTMKRKGSGFPTEGVTIDWSDWDIAEGLWSDSAALKPG